MNGFITDTTLDSVTSTLSYNGFGEVVGYSAADSGTEVFDVQYTRDKLGRITQKVETIGGQTDVYDYVYDVTGR